jgi:5'-3' exonuclease
VQLVTTDRRDCACRLLREYIELEFNATLGHKLSFPMDVERVVDDIVLFCMLVGNDFLPGAAAFCLRFLVTLS